MVDSEAAMVAWALVHIVVVVIVVIVVIVTAPRGVVHTAALAAMLVVLAAMLVPTWCFLSGLSDRKNAAFCSRGRRSLCSLCFRLTPASCGAERRV